MESAARILKFCSQYEPDRVIEKLGGHGIALVFEGAREGKTVMFRAELDGLPINEAGELSHHSLNKEISHKCGHDGHMAILCGLAGILQQRRPETGRVILFFQPAEETGKGAKAVIEDPKFQEITPDVVFALHNLPGFPLGSVIVKQDVFACASLGLLIQVKGETAHASSPEHGISPLPALIEMLTKLPQAPASIKRDDDARLAITYSRLGQFSFGTTPGDAELAATMRTRNTSDIELMKAEVVKMIRDISKRYSLEITVEWHERFNATLNDPEVVNIVRLAAETIELPLVEMKEPFWWSEDFGQFTERFPGTLFGLGTGENHPDLHTPNYDFPDEIIEPGIRIFYEIIKQLNH